MGRDTLGLADDSLFIDGIHHTFTAADANRLTGVHGVSKERACGSKAAPVHIAMAADLLLAQGVNGTPATGAPLTPFPWQVTIDTDEIRKRFGSTVSAEYQDLCPSLIIHSHTNIHLDTGHYRTFDEDVGLFGKYAGTEIKIEGE